MSSSGVIIPLVRLSAPRLMLCARFGGRERLGLWSADAQGFNAGVSCGRHLEQRVHRSVCQPGSETVAAARCGTPRPDSPSLSPVEGFAPPCVDRCPPVPRRRGSPLPSRYTSSVSGGSVANGLFARPYERGRRGFTGEAVDQQLVAPAAGEITADPCSGTCSRGSGGLLGEGDPHRVCSPTPSTTGLRRAGLEQLSAGRPLIFNAANMTTGVRFGFERDVLGDYVVGLAVRPERRVPTGRGGRGSAAFPATFADFEVGGIDSPARGSRAGCSTAAPTTIWAGAVDDLPDACLVAVNAGGTFQVRELGHVPMVRDLSG